MIGTRSTRTQRIQLLGIGGLALFAATACNVDVSFGTDGSGVAETVSFDLDSFDEVDISSAFNAEITVVEGPYSVEVTLDDNLLDDLKVEVDGDELNVEMDRGRVTFGVDPTVVISMPDLTELDLSGASSATVDGVDGAALVVNLSGASDAEVDGTVGALMVDSSGSGSIAFTGSADQLTLDLSGASSADFDEATIGTARVDMSGASNATFEAIDEVSGDLSGAASVSVPDGTAVTVSTSGGSSVDRN